MHKFINTFILSESEYGSAYNGLVPAEGRMNKTLSPISAVRSNFEEMKCEF
jgi:hypothetical protein